MKPKKIYYVLITIFTVLVICWGIFKYITYVPSTKLDSERVIVLPKQLEHQTNKIIAQPRVEKITENVFVALSYDLANVILIRTDAGNVIVDTASCPKRAHEIKKALQSHMHEKTAAVIYTHSHVDHMGGASAWVQKDTQVWATEAFAEHVFKQYGLFTPTERQRGWRQFGRHVTKKDLPTSSIGKRLDLEAVLQNGTRIPSHTFSDKHILHIGSEEIHLVEAHGETHDQLFVWLPRQKVLMAGDNYYHAFPNLYTIRGTNPRPIAEWIKSLDKMRSYDPDYLIPSHTQPVIGKDKIRKCLRDYRDAIQWIRDEVVRRANRGESLAKMTDEIALPGHLAQAENLRELYGQIDWSVRAIYTNELGWFDGNSDALYPLPQKELVRREIKLMGGEEKVLSEAKKAYTSGEIKWAIHLLAKLRDYGWQLPKVKKELAACYAKLGRQIFNTNGRAYLLERAYELHNGEVAPPLSQLDDTLIAQVPLTVIFRIMCSRIIPEKSINTHETVLFHMSDTQEKFFITIRRGIAELVMNHALPNTPSPVATVYTDSMTWKKLALNKQQAATAIREGKLKIEGKIAFLKFLKKFDRRQG
ncbi:alkyl sulfatase dimerization domain-containing protein [Candidatus Uabimicrobium amorphum]|uniref:MBL fold metallo-hydrolase n=1 Tax=Uabimicrobium amorphum TaxID=2596890 RepID=A0A5S9F230_UABAM|nr:alkyl sulfatase dimerization domain-containing protein [Candidatus Uabimicrobium amorphum]BBM83048.1 MBL fold metallo-hydrolase [Candidatus Uabimicrobium amorphum]